MTLEQRRARRRGRIEFIQRNATMSETELALGMKRAGLYSATTVLTDIYTALKRLKRQARP